VKKQASSFSEQAAWVALVKVKPTRWKGHGLQSWIEAAKKRLHHNVLAIALANKLARIAWSVLARGRAFGLHPVWLTPA
jgi:transposase